jgi:hypothetical protein
LQNGGFDVVIGNPPYVEYSNIKKLYTIKNYETETCGNLYAFVIEKSFKLIIQSGFIGIIIPLPSMNTSRMSSLQNLIKPNVKKRGRSIWISAFDERPSNLFAGVDQRLIIEIISGNVNSPRLSTTGIQRWYSHIRENLFSSISYSTQSNRNLSHTQSVLKVKNNLIETEIINKFYCNNPIELLQSDKTTKNNIYYRTAGGRYWKIITNKSSGTNTVSEKTAYFNSLSSFQAIALISSSTFWWYYSCHFDMFNLKDYMIFGFRFSDASSMILAELDRLGRSYIDSLEKNAKIKTIKSKTKGTVIQKQYIVKKSKPIIDEIDRVLAQHYGFTDEELDFIINYDIKYRMGSEEENDV